MLRHQMISKDIGLYQKQDGVVLARYCPLLLQKHKLQSRLPEVMQYHNSTCRTLPVIAHSPTCFKCYIVVLYHINK